MYCHHDKCCAFGHLGMRDALCIYDIPAARIFSKLQDKIAHKDYGWQGWVDINDGSNKHYRQPTPKARILAALDQIITQEKEAK